MSQAVAIAYLIGVFALEFYFLYESLTRLRVTEADILTDVEETLESLYKERRISEKRFKRLKKALHEQYKNGTLCDIQNNGKTYERL